MLDSRNSHTNARHPHLKPCPFCGGEAAPATCTVTRDRDIEGNKGTFTGYYVNCIMCGSDTRGIAEGRRTPEEAAEKWNRRAAQSGPNDVAKDGARLLREEAVAHMESCAVGTRQWQCEGCTPEKCAGKARHDELRAASDALFATDSGAKG